nr:MAG TPA: hypothetical protein [Bacteriophage sp.]
MIASINIFFISNSFNSGLLPFILLNILLTY